MSRTETTNRYRELSIEEAQQPEYVAFTGRYPFVVDAYELDFTIGVREDYTYQADDLHNVDLPVVMMDNYFENPDLDRYLGKYDRYNPSIAVLGDAFTAEEATELDDVAQQLLEEDEYKKIIAVPKCKEAFDILSDDLILGYPCGYSELKPEDYSTINDWRGRDIHVLGGSPPKQYTAIQDLTQPNLMGDPPANIVGADWNGHYKIAYLGEHWSRDGWQRADHLSIRETVRESLREIRQFWEEKDLWPETSPREIFGPAFDEPRDPVYAVNGADITSQEMLEDSIIEEYKDYGKLAFKSETEQAFLEYREGLELVD